MKREYGCLMADFNQVGWKDFIENLIDDKDIYKEEGYGLETDPHITILYGLHDDEFKLDELKKILPPIEKVFAFKKNISIFENENFDVLKFDIESSILHELNSAICEKFPYTSTFDYHPHMTIAYVKKGTGKKYISNNINPYNKMIAGSYRYGGGDGSNVYFK